MTQTAAVMNAAVIVPVFSWLVSAAWRWGDRADRIAYTAMGVLAGVVVAVGFVVTV